MPQISQKEPAFVLEKLFEKKARKQFKQHFNNDLFRHNLAKRQSNKTLQNTVHME